jgi:hypothetical protein
MFASVSTLPLCTFLHQSHPGKKITPRQYIQVLPQGMSQEMAEKNENQTFYLPRREGVKF